MNAPQTIFSQNLSEPRMNRLKTIRGGRPPQLAPRKVQPRKGRADVARVFAPKQAPCASACDLIDDPQSADYALAWSLLADVMEIAES